MMQKGVKKQNISNIRSKKSMEDTYLMFLMTNLNIYWQRTQIPSGKLGRPNLKLSINFPFMLMVVVNQETINNKFYYLLL